MLTCGRFSIPLGERSLIMGVLNLTPDSFSDGGRFSDPRRAVARALQMQEEGADLIDIGGESTRPAARPVPAREELRRVLPVIERLSGRLLIPISVDTSKSAVAREALRAGAALVNDITALRDPEMGPLVAEMKAPVILMHMRGTPRTMKQLARYRRLVPEIMAELRRSVRQALACGIRKNKILIDPGIGFAKTPQQNLMLLNHIDAFKKLGFPVVVGPSRKSFIGHAAASHQRCGISSAARTVPPRSLAEDRLFGTAAAVALAAFQGADILRVHDVAAMRQVVAVAHAIRGSR